MAADRPGAFVIFSVDIVGNGAAEGDELGPGADREEPAARHAHTQQCIERQTCLGAYYPRTPIGGQEMVDPCHVEQIPTAVEPYVPVRATQAAAQHGALVAVAN